MRNDLTAGLLDATRRGLKSLARRFGVGPLAALCERTTAQLDATASERAPTLLALSPERFPGDLAIIARSGRFRVFTFPQYWQYALLNMHSPADGTRDDFLARFMTAYAKRLGIAGVVGTSLWYRQDMPWGAAAAKTGIPFIVLHKECFKPTPLQMAATVGKARRWGPFAGRHLIVHNAPIRDALIADGFVDPSRVTAAGIMRMDEFVRRAATLPRPQRARPLVTYFSFAPGIGLDDLSVDPFPRDKTTGWQRLFDESHMAFAALARRRPDVDFLIKPKWFGQWTDRIASLIDTSGGSPSNLIVDVKIPAADLIFNSTVVCAFGSTTMLEAGLAGRPVVVPDFAEAAEPAYERRVKLREHYDLFDRAGSPAEFAIAVERRLADTSTIGQVRPGIRELFERWVSPCDGHATERYLDIIERATSDRRATAG